jgi:hypothetical protein
MKITDDQWSAIIAATRQSIDKLKAIAADIKRYDFRCEQGTAEEYAVLWTSDGFRRHAVAYKTADNELRPATLVVKKGGRIAGINVKPDPKAWAKLPSKPVADIVAALKSRLRH